MAAQKNMNFIMTGSILGGRGIEALATLQELIKIENSRCLMVLWEDEIHTPVYEAIKALPVELLVIPPPSLQASGNMTRQHLSFVSALPFFKGDDYIVRVRTDHNCRLAPIMDYLNKAGHSGPDPASNRVVVGAVSLLLPGRVEDFNYAGPRRAFDRFMWCESYFSEDYLPNLNQPGLGGVTYFAAEPELRWAGLYYAMKNPVYSFLYSKYNRYDFAFRFILNHVKVGGGDPYSFPTIAKYLMWQLANDYRQDFVVVRDNPPPPCSPTKLFSFENDQLSELFDLPNNKDIRVSSQWVVDTLAGKGAKSDQWQEFLEPAIELSVKEKRSPGSIIEELEQFMSPARTSSAPRYSVSRLPQDIDEKSQALLSVSQSVSRSEPFSTLRYAKSKLLAIRKANSAELDALLAQYEESGGVRGQHMDGFAAFFAALVSKLVDAGRNTIATDMLESVFGAGQHDISQFVQTLKVCTTCYAPDPNRLLLSDHAATIQTSYQLPENYHDYHLLGDFSFHVMKLTQSQPGNALLSRLVENLEPELNFCL